MTRLEQVLSVALLATIIVAAAVIYLISIRTIPSTGKIKTIGVEAYKDPNCTEILEMVDWGIMSPGDIAGFTCYCKNIRNVNFTMNINDSNWNPANISQYFILDWNYTGRIMHPEDVELVQVTLYLSVSILDDYDSTDIPDTFSFDINIIATEVSANGS